MSLEMLHVIIELYYFSKYFLNFVIFPFFLTVNLKKKSRLQCQIRKSMGKLEQILYS
jgi:hypothetical protein